MTPNINDIMDGLAMVLNAFRAANLKAPTTLLLESHDEGMIFLSALRQERQWVTYALDPSLGAPVKMADGSMWMEVKVFDIAVRWPANRLATKDGSWSYV